jgi:phosphoribosylaminoimidazolecarboxamide formyltransferase / IMP cyclohydrolase
MPRALLSVSDKTGIVDLGRGLSARGFELVSTGGTARALAGAGLAVTSVSDITGFPEMMDGRVKTLHPALHGGILARRDRPDDLAALNRHNIGLVDIVVVNLYPFRNTASNPSTPFDALVEEIDIGGPSLVRAAAKNFRGVLVVVEPADYPRLLAALDESPSLAFRFELMLKAFAHTADYDRNITTTLQQTKVDGDRLDRAHGLDDGSFPPTLSLPDQVNLSLQKIRDLRYGENPHQKAAMYSDGSGVGVANARQIQGKELSYNNIVDLQAAWDLAQEFNPNDGPVCAIIKHTNPAGAATGKTLAEAYKRALECDPVSAFGGVIGVNCPIDLEAAEEMHKLFLEVIAAPSFDDAAKARFATKKNLRLVEVNAAPQKWILKNVSGGILLQDNDMRPLQDIDLKVVTQRAPTPEETRALLFAWKICKHVKSNAIVYARDGQTVGVGAGQMSRVDSAKIGAMKAQLPLKGTVAASDAFFPFPDGVEEIAKAGATAIIQPGGSQRDPEVIAAADRLGLAMLFTGVRHFRH